MKKISLLTVVLLAVFITASCTTGKCQRRCRSGSAGACKGRKGMIELTGTLHRPVNGLPQIYLGEYGKIRRIDLKGSKIKDIEAGASIKITGSIRSIYFEGGTDADHLAMPSQWKLWFQVKNVEILKDN